MYVEPDGVNLQLSVCLLWCGVYSSSSVSPKECTPKISRATICAILWNKITGWTSTKAYSKRAVCVASANDQAELINQIPQRRVVHFGNKRVAEVVAELRNVVQEKYTRRGASSGRFVLKIGEMVFFCGRCNTGGYRIPPKYLSIPTT